MSSCSFVTLWPLTPLLSLSSGFCVPLTSPTLEARSAAALLLGFVFDTVAALSLGLGGGGGGHQLNDTRAKGHDHWWLLSSIMLGEPTIVIRHCRGVKGVGVALVILAGNTVWVLLSSLGRGRCKHLHARCIRHVNVNTPGLGEGSSLVWHWVLASV